MRSPGTAPVSSEILRAVPRAAPRTGTPSSFSLLGFDVAPRRFLGAASLTSMPIALSMSVAAKFAATDGGQGVLDIAMAELRRCGLERVLGKRLAVLGEKTLNDLAAEAGILAAHRGAGGAPDRGTRLAGDGEPFPGGRRHLRFGADDVDLVAILKLGRQWLVAAVDAAADAAVANAGVHGIGEVDRASRLSAAR